MIISKKIKKYIFIIVILLFSTNVFSNVVTDSDGTTFITKSEFEKVKKNLNENIKKYEKSLDEKIMGNIAEYLSGIAISKTIENYGYIKQIYDDNYKSLEFRYGKTYGNTTDNPLDINNKIINPFISIIGIYNQTYVNCQFVEYLSHNDGTHSGKWENENAGCYLAGFEERNFDGHRFFGLVDDYYTKKWQFQLIYSGMYEYSSQTGVQVGDAYFKSNEWDFKFSRPESQSITFLAGNKSIPCVQTCVNSFIDQKKSNTSCAPNYYTKSLGETIFGWKKDDFYIYKTDGTATKKETTLESSYRRHKDATTNIVKEEAFTYTINMPETIEVQFDKLINIEASDIVGRPVYSYNGIPLIYIEDEYNTIKIPLTVSNCGSVDTDKYKLYIARVPFDNNKITETTLTNEDILYKDVDFVPVGNRKIEIDISGKKYETLWIKVIPEEENEEVGLKISLTDWEPMLLLK